MEEELYRKLDGDCGKRVIFKMSRDRTGDRGDVRGAVIKGGSSQKVRKS